MTIRELFDAATSSEAPELVNIVAGRAGDNAADTVGWHNRYDTEGRRTREFMQVWHDTVIGILSDGPVPDVVDWFAKRGCIA